MLVLLLLVVVERKRVQRWGVRVYIVDNFDMFMVLLKTFAIDVISLG